MTFAFAAGAAGWAALLWTIAARTARRRGVTLASLPPVLVLGLAAIVAALLARTLPVDDAAAAALVLTGALVGAWTDARTGFLFDPLVAAIGLAGVALAIVAGRTGEALAGAAAAGTLTAIPYAVTRGRGLGFGDVKFAAVLGLGSGPLAAVVAVGTAFVLGAAYGVGLLMLRRARRGDAIRFGPFLGGGTALALGSAALGSPLFGLVR